MSAKLEAAQDELNRLVREKELLELRCKGDSHEMELLKVIFTLKHTFKLLQSMNIQSAPNLFRSWAVFKVLHFIWHRVDTRRLFHKLHHQVNGDTMHHFI